MEQVRTDEIRTEVNTPDPQPQHPAGQSTETHTETTVQTPAQPQQPQNQ